MAFTKLNDVRMHWRETGRSDAPAVIFANSLGTDCRLWDEIAQALCATYRVVLYDKRGHGLSENVPGPYSIKMLADDVLALADHLGLATFAFVGLSIGGQIAQQLAVQAPERLSALVVCDSAAKIGNDEGWNARIDAVMSNGLASITGPVMERWFTPKYHAEKQMELAGWIQMLLGTPNDGYAACCAALREADLTQAIPGIKTPTLVVCGDGDQSTPPELVQKTAALIPGARFALIDDCGHIPPAEQPGALLALLTRHFEEHIHA
ncbi:3-oxoadipate enol-lactonase [Acidocella sp.]|uniref:3-oxoadipate enol-lactonase n=1 Tax=Acidocella sp. TaxID=50710 RepID=UPI003D04FCAA